MNAQVVIFAVAALCVVLYTVPRPITALRNYLLMLPFLPEFLVMNIGVKITASRISTLIFLVVMLFRATERLVPRWDKLDTAVFLFLGIYLVAVVPGPPENGPVFAAGFLLDVIVPYYFLRALIRTTEELKTLIGSLLIPTYFIVVLAVYQSVTGWGLFDQFKTGEEIFGVYDSGMKRLGLTRADVGLTHYIMMGMFFAAQMPIAIGHYVGLGMDFGRTLLRVLHFPLGAFCSLSGGSFLVTGIGVGSMTLKPLRKIWFLVAVLALVGFVFVETFSNRGTFAILATMAATDGDSAWYRIRLPAAVFAIMDGQWWGGFGRDKPDLGYFDDITNHYLWWLLQGGIPCVIAFVGCFVAAFNRLYRSQQLAVHPYLRGLNWGLCGCILGLMLGMLTVSLFGQMRTYLFLFFALASCSYAAALGERRQACVAGEEELSEEPVDEPGLQPTPADVRA